MARAYRSSSAEKYGVEPVGADLVALAQAHALDATVFPHPSILPVLGADAAPNLWIARAEKGGPVVGFIATRTRHDVLEISGLAIDEAHRRSGFGRALVRAAVRSARTRGFDSISLHVSTGNAAAVELYLGERFRKDQHLAGFYSAARFPDNGDAWVMIRDVR